MKKRFAMIFAALMAASMMTGCGALSAEDYKEELEDAMSDCNEAMSDLMAMQYEDEDDFDKGDAKEKLNDAKSALNSIKRLSAPKEIKDEHKEFCKLIDYTIKAADVQYELVVAAVADDDDKVEKLEEKMEEIQEEMEDKCDSSAYADLYSALNELIEEEEDD
ncbi:MAG: hypothetical protein E7478_06095 [Ruminococcaceae bacterium]|nr:hypothetical protein [Oscillospiraceae bacterium]